MINTQPKSLRDGHGRQIRKLRVSLLDACNFRCFYCMPEEVKFASPSEYLSPSSLIEICDQLVELGIEQIRVTGGEPTLRKEFREIMEGLSRLDIKKLALTTNGMTLKFHLPFLKAIGCKDINISLDSLDENRFNEITRTRGFRKVLDAIVSTQEMGFNVKVNTVLMAGRNDHEIYDFVEFSRRQGIEVRFLEMMKIGQACQSQVDYFVSAASAIQKISKKSELIPEQVEFDSTSFNFTTPDGARIGFIASESQPFCRSCSRLRLSHNGFLRACLMSEEGLSLKGLTSVELDWVLHQVMGMKPMGRISHVVQDMYQIGG